MSVDLKQYLIKQNLLNWLDSISKTDIYSDIKQAASELVYIINGDSIIPPKPSYNHLYLNYKFKLISTIIDNKNRILLYSYNGNEQIFIGVVSGDISGSDQRCCTIPPNSPTPTVTPSVTITPTISATVSITPSVSRTPTITPTISKTPTVTPTITKSERVCPSPTVTKTVTPSITVSTTVSNTPVATSSNTPTVSTTSTVSITPTVTVTPTLTSTPNKTPSPTPSITPSITSTATITPSVTKTVSVTPTVTRTATITPTVTRTATITPTVTRTATITPTPSVSITPSITPSQSKSVSIVWSITNPSNPLQETITLNTGTVYVAKYPGDVSGYNSTSRIFGYQTLTCANKNADGLCGLTSWSQSPITFYFSTPVTNPYLALYSVGNTLVANSPLTLYIKTSVEPKIYCNNVTDYVLPPEFGVNNPKRAYGIQIVTGGGGTYYYLVGAEAYGILYFPGTHTSITFNTIFGPYSEYYTNYKWGLEQ